MLLSEKNSLKAGLGQRKTHSLPKVIRIGLIFPLIGIPEDSYFTGKILRLACGSLRMTLLLEACKTLKGL